MSETATRPGVDVERLLAALVALGVAGPSREVGVPWRGAPLDDAAWRTLLRRANHERVVGLVARAVELGELPVTAAQERELGELHAAAMAVALELDARLIEAAGALEAAGVGFRVLKGAAAAHLDYPDPALRQYGDVDLLVPSAQLHDAERALAGLDYTRQVPSLGSRFERRFAKTITLASSGRWELDLHRTLALEPFGLTIDEAELLAGVTSFRVAGRELPALDAPRRLLHAAIHGSLGNWPPRLVPHRDLAALAVRHDDHRDVVALAEQWALGAVLADAIDRAWRLFGLNPAHQLAEWAHTREATRAETVALAAFQRHDRRQRHRSLATLRVVPSVRARLAYARHLALPDRAHLDARGISRLSWVRRALGARIIPSRRRGPPGRDLS